MDINTHGSARIAHVRVDRGNGHTYRQGAVRGVSEVEREAEA